MSYYSTCPMCSATLDPSEKCDCIKENPLPVKAITKKRKNKNTNNSITNK